MIYLYLNHSISNSLIKLFVKIALIASIILCHVGTYTASAEEGTDTLTLCFTGDIMLHSRQMEYDHKDFFIEIEDTFRKADLTIANLEFTLAGEPYTGYPQFSAPDSYAEHLADCGVDIFLCANNHILDKGSSGAERTLQQYRRLADSHGIHFTGAAGSQEELDETTPLVLKLGKSKIALVNFTYGTNLGYTTHWPRINYLNQRKFLAETLHKADSLADFTIVLPHWGEEYNLLHSENQEITANWMIENGADMIIGTHPHVIQEIEEIDGVPVAYSLGNTVSNMSAANTQLGLLLIVTLITDQEGKVISQSLEPIYIWCSRPGGYNNSYCVIPVEGKIDSRSRWIGGWEYDKMITTYERVRKTHNENNYKNNE